MSIMPLEADIHQRGLHVLLVPRPDIYLSIALMVPRNVEQTNRDSLIEFSVGRALGTMNFRTKASAERR